MKQYEAEDVLPDYLELKSDEETFSFYYCEEEEVEKVIEVRRDKPVVELFGEGFVNADYDLFVEEVEKALHEFGELENPYTLLEQVNNYA